MRERRPSTLSARRGFTLLELLIVVLIIAVLASVLISALGSAKRRAQVAVAKSNIQSLKAALSMYESEVGRYPKRPYTTLPAATLAAFVNDIHYAWAALRNRPTQTLMGGPNSPYVEWKPEQIGWPLAPTGTWDQPAYANNSDGIQVPVPPGTRAQPIPTGSEDYNKPTGAVDAQDQHLPTSAQPYIFLDPWGNPYVYVEWASMPTATKDQIASAGLSITSFPNPSGGGTGTSESHPLNAHDPSKFDLYSYGPNGVNEGGDPLSDDVSGWADTRGRN